MNFIVVVDENYAIGQDNNLLTHLPGDLKYFKQKTINKVIIMGRETFQSLPGGKPLPQRTTIVLTRDQSFKPNGVLVVNSTQELFELLKDYDDDTIFIAGGANVYKQFIPYCQYGFVTHIKSSFPANKYIDNIEQNSNWKKIWSSEIQSEKGFEYTFTQYKNNNLPKYKS